MHGVSGAVGNDFSQNAMAQQCEITDKIENLVANEFIVEAERTVLHASVGQHDRVLFRRAANESHVAQRSFIAQESESSCRCDFSRVAVASEIDVVALNADRLGKIDGVGN